MQCMRSQEYRSERAIILKLHLSVRVCVCTAGRSARMRTCSVRAHAQSGKGRQQAYALQIDVDAMYEGYRSERAKRAHSLYYIFLQSYMALPKGGLVAEHVLILPIGHYAASTDTPQVSYIIQSIACNCSGGKTNLVYFW
jgi:hypothetical protein